ncbi:hypothetical protein CY34DRAFT_804568, partial [Suillus luteus UH-Slu-Lm8-n1]
MLYITSRRPCPGSLTFLVFPNTPPYRPINTRSCSVAAYNQTMEHRGCSPSLM